MGRIALLQFKKITMTKRAGLILLFFIASVSVSTAQSLDHLKAINQVWAKFYQAFETLDYQPMAEIHSKDVVRISGGSRIIDYETYINNYKRQFEANRTNNSTRNISLRFFERLNNDATASERGIYKLTVNKGKTDEQHYYGQFHVIMKKENGTWKITMDYDSDENNTIDEQAYLKAHAIDDFDTFVKQ